MKYIKGKKPHMTRLPLKGTEVWTKCRKWLNGHLSRQKPPVFWTYSDITLKRFLEVASTGNVGLLLREGSATSDRCSEAWEAILKDQGEASNSRELELYKDLSEEYARLLLKFNVEKGIILKLSLRHNAHDVGYLRELGYNFVYKNSAEYAKCLELAVRRSDGLITRITMKEKELAKLHKDDDRPPQSLGQILAGLSFHVGFRLTEDITLSEFNHYRKLVEEKHRMKNKPTKTEEEEV